MNFLGPDESADFTSRLRRQGGTTNAQSQPFQFPSTAPTGNFKPQGITPPGPNHSQQWFGDRPMGGFQHPQNGGVVPPGPWGGGKSMVPGSEPYRDPITGAQVGLNNPSPMGGGFQRPGGGYDSSGINPHGMYGGGGIQGGPFGPPQPDRTGGPMLDWAPRGGEGGNPWQEDTQGDPRNRPMGQADPKYPLGMPHQRMPQQTRGQWQQNRLGNPGPQIPQESPIFPTNGWGSNNRGW